MVLNITRKAHSSNTTTTCDVLIVGAGLSGLRAAIDVQRAGLSCVVLEATDRVGGKTLSVPSSTDDGGVVDLGAAWINDTNQTCMWALAQKYGLAIEKQRATGLTIHENTHGELQALPYGQMPISGEDAVALRKFFALIEATASEVAQESFSGPQSTKLDKITLAKFCRMHSCPALVEQSVNLIAAALVGAEAEEISALFLLRYIHSGTGIFNMISDEQDGGQYIRLHEGQQTFATHLAKELRGDTIRLSSAVISISQSENTRACAVTTRSGVQFISKRVIVSVPTTLYPTISFIPPLPSAKMSLGESTVLGYYSKVILGYSSPWWVEAGLSGSLSSIRGPISFTRDTCIPAHGQYSITCFLVGELGRQWSKRSLASRRSIVLEQVRRMFSAAVSSSDEIPEPTNIIEYEWSKQSFFWGAPSPFMPPGVLTSDAGKVLTAPCGKIHFVGTETADVWEGYMEGAVRSGERGAKEVIEALASHQ